MPDLSALFDPKGIIITGVSNHPGKFGFVTLHNILTSGYEGRVFPVSREPGEVLGLEVLGSIADVPDGAADMVFICTPPAINEGLLRQAAAKGVTAAFCAAGGYREAGPEGGAAEEQLVALCHELGIALAGPNGQGVVSTPAKMCAQIVAPYAPPGKIAIASQARPRCVTCSPLSASGRVPSQLATSGSRSLGPSSSSTSPARISSLRTRSANRLP